MTHNTAKQNEHCLTNFELSEYQQVFGDLNIQIYRQLIKSMEDILQPLIGEDISSHYNNKKTNRDRNTWNVFFLNLCLIVASMLEHETIQGVLGSKPTGLRKRSTSFPEEGAITVEVLLQRLSHFYTTMSQHGMDPDLMKQVVKQLFYIICAVTLNHLLLRKDMCSWSKGLQIRYSTANSCYYTLWTQIRGTEECRLRCVGSCIHKENVLLIEKEKDNILKKPQVIFYMVRLDNNIRHGDIFCVFLKATLSTEKVLTCLKLNLHILNLFPQDLHSGYIDVCKYWRGSNK